MSQEQILKTLTELGLTRIDSQIYIYVSKRGPLRGREIAQALGMSKQQLYRSLKNLQIRGLVDCTLEYPAQFSALPFDKAVDLSIQVKLAEAQRIKESKHELLSNWQSMSVGDTLSNASGKFTVIEGRGYIQSKILQMVNEANAKFSFLTSVRNLGRSDQFGLFETLSRRRPRIRIQFITELTPDNTHVIKGFLADLKKSDLLFDYRTPELKRMQFPQIALRDDEEALFFVSPSENTGDDDREICFWTNCSPLAKALARTFNDLWQNSSDVQLKIEELGRARLPPEANIVSNIEQVHKEYSDALMSAKKEITMVTSSHGLSYIIEGGFLRKWRENKVSVRVMMPITSDVVCSMSEILSNCDVRHVPIGDIGATVIDGKEVFQYRMPSHLEKTSFGFFENLSRSIGKEYTAKTKKAIENLWANSQPSRARLQSISSSVSCSLPDNFPTRRVIETRIRDVKQLAEKDVIDEIIHGKKFKVNDVEKDVNRLYASVGSAVIYPPSHLKLPILMLEPMHVERESSLGADDILTVYQWFETEKENGFASVAVAMTNKDVFGAVKQMVSNNPVPVNMCLVRQDELQVRIRGNTLFAGWSVPIKLGSPKMVLPPAYLTLEGYGKVHSVGYSVFSSSPFKSVIEKNYFEAFVTFMLPKSEYWGPGVDGYFCRDFIETFHPIM